MVKDTAFVNILLSFLAIVFIIAVGVVLLYQHFQKNLFLQKLKQETLKNLYQNNLLRSNIETQEEERKRIAQDLHDELGSVLSIIRMNLIMLEEQHKGKDEKTQSSLRNVKNLSESALLSVRNISHKLMPPQLEAFGLVKTLEAVSDQINSSGNITIALNANSHFDDLPKQVCIGMYRIVMELINNTIKHSGATLITIDMYVKDNDVVCKYSDNGKGVIDGQVSNGMGHKSIEGRVAALDGKFKIDSGDNRGFNSTVQIPRNGTV